MKLNNSENKVKEPAYTLLYEPKKLSLHKSINNTQILYSMVSSYLPNKFNSKQEEFFHYNFLNRISLLWGPPGTGKTTVLAGVILGWIEEYLIKKTKNKTLKICIGSSNYNAIDNVLIEVLKLLKMREENTRKKLLIRIQRLRSESAQKPSSSDIEDVLINSLEAKQLIDRLDSNGSGIVVVGGTWQQLGKLATKQENDKETTAEWFDLLVIDEASQVQVSTAASYFLLLQKTAHVILAGDDKQLGPIYGFNMQDKAKGLFDCIFTYMKETHEILPIQLSQNYRTNVQISAWPESRFYNNQYSSFFENKKLDIQFSHRKKPKCWPNNLAWSDIYWDILDPKYPVVVITYPSKIYTVSNSFEAQIVAALTYLYRSLIIEHNDFWTDKIGLVTPHRAQMSLIKNILLEALPVEETINSAVFVDTVDRFQGQERDLIISSYVVADKDFIASEDDFILSSRRFNVTLTRARSKFIMVISDSLLQYLPTDPETARDAAHLQLFVQKYCRELDSNIVLPYVNKEVIESNICKMYIKD
ncbi:AAA domain-containing protein [Acinetobacter radioresistens]|uniref:AAA domain-containing protein n=1 Tax=Acinetobacter radioresistens TaxID=40216 RepID=UPI00254C4F35|nr:AAA domain-containing protein [Acinetobacter radioresistens]MDK8754244.1 AAA domain-containing protein [Acinetobacter radioresistens]